MTSIRLGAKPNVRESSKGKGKSKGRVQDDNFGPASLFTREAVDFDLVSQLTHMAAVSTAPRRKQASARGNNSFKSAH